MGAVPDHLDFRVVSEEEADVVWGIVNTSFEEYRNSEAPSSALLETVEQVRQALSNGREKAMICYYDNTPAGSVRFYIENGLYFRRLGVLPEFRRMGISKAIIRWLENYATSSGQARIWCNTRSSVKRNMHLYSSMGYILEEQRTVQRNNKTVGVATFSKCLDR